MPEGSMAFINRCPVFFEHLPGTLIDAIRYGVKVQLFVIHGVNRQIRMIRRIVPARS
jgi:hypothetical protein